MEVTADMLPDEVLLMIFRYCSIHDIIISIRNVCKRWEELSKSKCLWNSVVYKPAFTANIKHFIETLKMSPKLQNIDLSEMGRSDEVVKVLSDYCTELKTLYMPKSHDIYLKLFENLLIKNPNIQEIGVCGQKMLGLAQRILKIESLCYITNALPNSFNVFATGLPYLEHLNIIDANIRENDFKLLSEKMHLQLLTLKVSCRFVTRGCVLPHLSSFTKLKSLSLQYLCHQTDPLLILPQVQTLDISNGDFNKPLQTVACIKMFPKVRKLKLSSCHIYDTFIPVLAFRCPLIQKIVVEGQFVSNNIPNHGGLILTALIFPTEEPTRTEKLQKDIPCLSHLELNHCSGIDPATTESWLWKRFKNIKVTRQLKSNLLFLGRKRRRLT